MGKQAQGRITFHLHRFSGQVGNEELERSWCDFAETFPPAAPFCRPHTWLSWYRSNSEIEAVVFERREEGVISALIGMYQRGNTLYAATDTDLDYQDVTAVNLDAATGLLVSIAEYCTAESIVIIFGKVAAGSLLGQSLSHPRVLERASVQSRYWSTCPFQDYNIEADGDILRSLSKKKQTNFRRRWRAFTKKFPDLVVEHLVGAEIGMEAIDLIGEMHKEGQRRRPGISIFENSRFAEFLFLEATRENNLELFMLRAKPGGTLFAFGLGYYQEDTFYYYLTGYEARYSRRSPGMLLLVHMLRDCAGRSEGASFRFDFLSGMERYKEHWASTAYRIDKVRMIPRKARHLPLRCACSAAYTVKAVKNRMLSHCGILSRSQNLAG